MAKYTSIGGQALIEGIMMKSPEKTALAVRTPDRSIDITYLNGKSIREKHKILKLPILRGIAGFVESMIQGYKAMMLSADKSGFTDLEEEEKEKTESNKKKESALMSAIMVIATVLGVALAVVLFMLLPRLAVQGLRTLFKAEFSPVVRSSLEQLLKLTIFVAYVWAVSFMKDIKRVFMYHGAEHKCINCIEHGMELTVENVRKSSRQHKRCGTSFLLFVMIVSIIFFAFIRVDSPVLRLVLRLALIPVIAGVSYELIRLAGRSDNGLVNLISKPGLMLQGLTTREPDDAMIEVGIASVEAIFDWRAYLAEEFAWTDTENKKGQV